jgi:pyrroline-5-carboxylate reductase
VRGSVARAVREATIMAGQLGKGAVGVTGSRFPPADMD